MVAECHLALTRLVQKNVALRRKPLSVALSQVVESDNEHLETKGTEKERKSECIYIYIYIYVCVCVTE
jgi:hypothetical protein